MINHNKRGFTLIELMVALVVSGLMMASLVALSSAVQKSFGRSKEVSELQTNLRFAIRKISEDISRAGFMYAVDPSNPSSSCNTSAPPQNLPPTWNNWQAIFYNPNTLQLNIRGNFQSTRDYRVQITSTNTAQIVCRDSSAYTPGNPASCSSYLGAPNQINNLILPFTDGYGFQDLFYSGQLFRLETEAGKYSYLTVASANPITSTITFTPPINWNLIRGTDKFINPFGTITYQVAQDGTYNPIYPSGLQSSFKWILQRTWSVLNVTNTVNIAEFLLPSSNALSVQVITDTNPNAGICQPAWPPQINLTPANLVGPINSITTRAVVITLSGRTETEDPNFTLATPTATGAQDYGIDLDGDPTDGLAHVRIEHRVVEMRNLNYSLTNF
jgi:prepilin-type N-terminal cleavage/methylation domain-containing protein